MMRTFNLYYLMKAKTDSFEVLTINEDPNWVNCN